MNQNLCLSAWLIWPLLQPTLQNLKSQVSSVFRGPFYCSKPIWKHLGKGMWLSEELGSSVSIVAKLSFG